MSCCECFTAAATGQQRGRLKQEQQWLLHAVTVHIWLPAYLYACHASAPCDGLASFGKAKPNKSPKTNAHAACLHASKIAYYKFSNHQNVHGRSGRMTMNLGAVGRMNMGHSRCINHEHGRSGRINYAHASTPGRPHMNTCQSARKICNSEPR
jgi:hypothetical protein